MSRENRIYGVDGRLQKVEFLDDDGVCEIEYDLQAMKVTNWSAEGEVSDLAQETVDHFLTIVREEDRMGRLAEAVEQIVAIKDAALADQARAQQIQHEAGVLSGQLAALVPVITGWTPGVTYRQSDLILIRDQLAAMIQRQKALVDAFRESAVYREANDGALATVYGAVLWLGEQTAGIVVDDG